MKVGELIRIAKLTQKGSVAAGFAPRLDLTTVGITIGQKQSTGDTSRVVKGTALGGTKPARMLRRSID